MRININNVKNSNIAVEGDIIQFKNYNAGEMGKPEGWKYEIRVGKDVAGVQTWTTEQIKDTFSKHLAKLGIEDFETGEKIGYWRGEPEESNLMVIIRKAEDGDVYDDLLGVIKRANTELKQDAILSSKIDLSRIDFAS